MGEKSLINYHDLFLYIRSKVKIKIQNASPFDVACVMNIVKNTITSVETQMEEMARLDSRFSRFAGKIISVSTET